MKARIIQAADSAEVKEALSMAESGAVDGALAEASPEVIMLWIVSKRTT